MKIFEKCQKMVQLAKNVSKIFGSQKSLAYQRLRASGVLDWNFSYWFWRNCHCAEISVH